MKMERRFIPNSDDHPIALRAEGDDKAAPKLIGYGAVFNSRSENLGGFTEIIEPGAFDEVLENDVRGLFNHDANLILGRNKSGTMRISVDAVGLRYEIDVPNTGYIRDLVVEPIRRGDVTGSSFGFRVDDDDWSEDDEGRITRKIRRFSKLFDVGPVTFPAYAGADTALRSLAEFKKSRGETVDQRSIEELIEELEQRDTNIATLQSQNAAKDMRIADLQRVNRVLSAHRT